MVGYGDGASCDEGPHATVPNASHSSSRPSAARARSRHQIDEIKAFYDQSDPVGQDRVIVAPYDYDGPGGQLPDGVQMALVAWRRLQTCATPDLAVAFDFTSQFSYPTTQDREYTGEAPERGAAM